MKSKNFNGASSESQLSPKYAHGPACLLLAESLMCPRHSVPTVALCAGRSRCLHPRQAATSASSVRVTSGLENQLGGRASTASGKGKGSQGQVKVFYGFNLVKGNTNHPMEDYHVAELVQAKGNELGLFAIFDGHLGNNVPAYLQKNLFSNILNDEEFWTHPDRAITKAYEKTNQAILSHTPDLGQGGSTAVTAILIDGRKLWVANVGDSRAVLLKGGQAIPMSTDHDPNVERSVIENRGGFVSNMPGDVPRVCGQLAVSRAFGDKNLKSLLRSEPDIRVEDIDYTAELLILASDGLWKVMNNQEAVDLAKRFKDPHVAAKQLTAEALKRESKDDISCIVVRFKV